MYGEYQGWTWVGEKTGQIAFDYHRLAEIEQVQLVEPTQGKANEPAKYIHQKP